jgi:hypothetical protein
MADPTRSRIGSHRSRRERVAAIAVGVSAGIIAIVSARDYAGSWNDGSRLATVESLVDRHTLRIDDSIFVRVPPSAAPARPSPYRREDSALVERGTQDKLLIDGHFYSDKSPVPAVVLAGFYQALQWTSGLRARDRPERFCYWMTLGSSGLAYVIAGWCMFQVAGQLRVSLPVRVALTASLGLGTVALTYTRHVNNHILLLAVAAALALRLTSLAKKDRAAALPPMKLIGLGTLAGLGYTIDLGAGPLLLVCTLGLVAYRWRWRAFALCAVAALPWLMLHHALNYAIGGTLRPANAVPEYLSWPGSAFSRQSMTGTWHHTPGHFLIYAAALLVGKRGFLTHNPTLFLAVPAAVIMLRRSAHELLEIVWASSWCLATWLIYALTSNNYSGACASIRWFVPLLAPSYLVLAVFLREHPRYVPDFITLSAWGVVLAIIMWWEGPWIPHMVPYYWSLQAAALASWAGCWAWRRRLQQQWK